MHFSTDSLCIELANSKSSREEISLLPRQPTASSSLPSFFLLAGAKGRVIVNPSNCACLLMTRLKHETKKKAKQAVTADFEAD